MTVSTTESRVRHEGNGVATSFPYAFKMPNAASVVIVIVDEDGVETTLTTSQYSITGLGEDDGGAVTYPVSGSPLPIGSAIVIIRQLDKVQETDLTNGDGFYPETIEDAFDYVTMLIQQESDTYARAVKVPISDGNDEGLTLPNATARANKYFRFDADGDASVVDSQIETIYYGASATTPTTRPDGSAIETGDLYFNSVAKVIRVWNGTIWIDASQALVSWVDSFSGDGSDTTFTMSHTPLTENAICVFIDGVYQHKNTFSISGTTLTFSTAPPNGTAIEVAGQYPSGVDTSIFDIDTRLNDILAGDEEFDTVLITNKTTGPASPTIAGTAKLVLRDDSFQVIKPAAETLGSPLVLQTSFDGNITLNTSHNVRRIISNHSGSGTITLEDGTYDFGATAVTIAGPAMLNIEAQNFQLAILKGRFNIYDGRAVNFQDVVLEPQTGGTCIVGINSRIKMGDCLVNAGAGAGNIISAAGCYVDIEARNADCEFVGGANVSALMDIDTSGAKFGAQGGGGSPYRVKFSIVDPPSVSAQVAMIFDNTSVLASGINVETNIAGRGIGVLARRCANVTMSNATGGGNDNIMDGLSTGLRAENGARIVYDYGSIINNTTGILTQLGGKVYYHTSRVTFSGNSADVSNLNSSMTYVE